MNNECGSNPVSPSAMPDARTERAKVEFSLAYAGLFFLIFSFAQAGLIVYFRWGLMVPVKLLWFGGNLFAACAFAPFLVPERFRSRMPLYLHPLVGFAILLPAFSAYVLGSLAPALAYLYTAFALAATAQALRRLGRLTLRHFCFLLLAPVFAAYVFQYFNSWNYAGVYAPAQALLGQLRKDTYYHAAIAQMLQNFGTISTGMDGLIRLNYHVGTHAWIAAIGRSTGTMPLLTYPFIQMIVLIPALLFALSQSIICAAPGRRGPFAAPGWAMALVLGADALGRPSHYVSESYTAGLAALLFFWPLLLDLIRRPRGGKASDALRLSAALAAIFVLYSLKISVGILWTGALGWVLLRQYGKGLKGLAGSVGAGLIALTAFSIFYDPGMDTDWEPFDSFAHLPARLLLVNLIVPGLYVGAVIAGHKLLGGGALRPALADRSILGVEVIALMTLAAAMPAALLKVPIASAWFFMNIPMWPAWSMLVAEWRWPDKVHVLQRRITYAAALVVAGLLAGWGAEQLGSAFQIGYLDRGRRFLRSSGGRPHSPPSPDRPYGTQLDPLLAATPGYKAYALIMEAAQGQGPRFAVKVPASNRQFWNIVKNCEAQSMFVPAVTGKPMLYGLLPPDMPCELEYYGYPDYGDDAFARNIDRETLCRHAVKKGFEPIFVLYDLDHPEKNLIVHCDQPDPAAN